MTIFWKGKSVLDGAPIRLALSANSTNRKTGSALQTWILRDDVSPIEAVQKHLDRSICGGCRLRHNLGGGCYVLPFQAPNTIWKAKDVGTLPYGFEFIRLGAYGDPAAVPEEVWGELLSNYPGYPVVGYTHQWRHPAAQWLQHLCMASTHTRAETRLANEMGWAAFQTLTDLDSVEEWPDDAERCKSPDVQCSSCLRCDTRRNIVIETHGARRNSFAQFVPVR